MSGDIAMGNNNISGGATITATTFSGELNGTIHSATTATTQSAGNNSTKVATTAYADAASTDDQTAAEVNSSATGAIASTTVQTALAELDTEKLALAGGTMSGDIAMGSNRINNLADPTSAQDAATKNYVDGTNSTYKIYTSNISSSQTISVEDLEEYNLFFVDNTSGSSDLTITLNNITITGKTITIVEMDSSDKTTNRILVNNISPTLLGIVNLDNNINHESLNLIWSGSAWRVFR